MTGRLADVLCEIRDHYRPLVPLLLSSMTAGDFGAARQFSFDSDFMAGELNRLLATANSVHSAVNLVVFDLFDPSGDVEALCEDRDPERLAVTDAWTARQVAECRFSAAEAVEMARLDEIDVDHRVSELLARRGLAPEAAS